MRKTKRFTPSLFEKYRNLERGTGTFENYIPFHRVGRSDPSSFGRSHLQLWNGRHREFLSDGEWVAFLFAIMLPDIVDIREQFPLQFEISHHELLDYQVSASQDLYAGTDKISKFLKIKHPRVNGNGTSAPWPMTTDLLLTIKNANGALHLLAVSCKPKGFELKKRARQLLDIERIYWQERGVEWLLITPELYDFKVALTLRNCVSWALGKTVEESLLIKATEDICKLNGRPLSFVLQNLSLELSSMDLAQRVFWQSVTSGLIPLELRRSWRPHVPIEILSKCDFWQLNPIASRRTAWI